MYAVEGDYPKKKADPHSVYEQLKEMLPNADPTYLEEQANSLIYQPENALETFVENAIEKQSYPTFTEYLK